jgi:hypothetical protein
LGKSQFKLGLSLFGILLTLRVLKKSVNQRGLSCSVDGYKEKRRELSFVLF